MRQMIFVIVILLYLIGNFYIFHHLWTAVPTSTTTNIGICASAAIVILSLILYFVAGESMPIAMTRFFFMIGTSWLFIMIYFVIVFLVKDLCLGLPNKFLHFMPSDALTRFTKENWVGLAFMVGFIFLLMICGYMKYTWKVRVELPIALEKPIANRDSLRIVAISDLHLGYGIGKKEFESWVEKINKENPDIVLIAGDIVDSSVRPLDDQNIAESFKKIEAPLGIYSCVGNHEFLSDLRKSSDFIKRSGVKLLRDEAILVDSSFYIVGRDDKSNHRRKQLNEIVDNLDKSKPIILLDHQPFHLEEAEKNNIDLQLSGHTHKGQVWPISMITNAMYEIDHGYLKKRNTHIYVSSGIGIWGGKFRIGTQSEYVVITLKGKECEYSSEQ